MTLGFQKVVVDVHVSDLGRAIHFYNDILGLPLLTQKDTWASFEAAGTEIHLYTQGGLRQGLEFRVLDIATAVQALKAQGVVFLSMNQHPDFIRLISDEISEWAWGQAAFFKDSEGNTLTLIQDL